MGRSWPLRALVLTSCWTTQMGGQDVFVRNTVSGTTRGVGIMTNASMLPVLSLNGHSVAYLRGAGGGSSLGFIRLGDVHWLDLEDGTDVALATNTGMRAAISGDGRYVACQDGSPLSRLLRPSWWRTWIARTNVFETNSCSGRPWFR
jgi:hypothetical protein